MFKVLEKDLSHGIIILADGQKATVIFGDESNYQHSCIVKLENGQLKVVEEKNISLLSLN
ncbi:bacteriocin [Lactococcus lactis]|uniref:bacteriocin n=1 Tax=Lactococcus lactis TaxID=1358 RepID=UPI001784A30A|nr:bacteriocin [Lactococcus lactis]MBD5855825.1 bacteriocin [Lactococcus lactis]